MTIAIAQPALETLNDLIADIFKRICKETEFLMMESDKKTMELRDIHYMAHDCYSNPFRLRGTIVRSTSLEI